MSKSDSNKLPAFSCPICGTPIINLFVNLPKIKTYYNKMKAPVPILAKCSNNHDLVVYIHFEEGQPKITQVDKLFVSHHFKVIKYVINHDKISKDTNKGIAVFNKKKNILVIASLRPNELILSFLMDIIERVILSLSIEHMEATLLIDNIPLRFTFINDHKNNILVFFSRHDKTLPNELILKLLNELKRVNRPETIIRKVSSYIDML
ncbi:MAG: hypothetical protein ABGF52_03740 [Candidatus Asgardarchaeum sp.]